MLAFVRIFGGMKVVVRILMMQMVLNKSPVQGPRMVP